MKLEELTWPEVEHYLKTNKTIIVPVGSTEQHGPTGILGIDWISARDIAFAVGENTKTLVAPALPIGMALHHMGFPGTISFTPSTYLLVIQEIIHSLAAHGFERLVFVNGHGGNIAPITTAFSESLIRYPQIELELVNWWHLPETTAYEKQFFSEQNGFHATCGEIAVTMHTQPQAYRATRPFKYTPTPVKHAWPLSPSEFRKTFHDGRMGSNPELSTAAHGEKIFQLAVDAISRKLAK